MIAELKHVTKRFRARDWGAKPFYAAKDVTLAIPEGETVGLVGESGCGKSTIGRLLLRLLPVDEGTVNFQGADITRCTYAQLRPLRTRMQMLFQHPDSSFHPRRTLLQSLIEPILLHRLLPHKQACDKAGELLDIVGLPSELLSRYPHQVSGGQLQRAALARALTVDPRLLILDEPTSMLDVSIQAQVVEVLHKVQQRFGLSYLFISHDLDVIRAVSSRIAVMQAGCIVEAGETDQVLTTPTHPYTRQLLEAFDQF